MIELNYEPMITLFSFLALIGIGILLWMKTKSGKKWLKNL